MPILELMNDEETRDQKRFCLCQLFQFYEPESSYSQADRRRGGSI